MRRLILDYDWFVSVAMPFWSTIEELLPQPSTSVHLATTIMNHELRQFFILARWLNDDAENPVSQVSWARLEGEIPGGFIWYPGTKWMCMMGSLLTMYFDLHEKEVYRARMTDSVRWTKATLTLRLLYYHRISCHTMVSNGSTFGTGHNNLCLDSRWTFLQLWMLVLRKSFFSCTRVVCASSTSAPTTKRETRMLEDGGRKCW
jgi:hypothetical protein